ncbi:MAG: glycosyltransferase [Lachnospiraceae bacterium]|nr:glycosyltransferase [Lachnospiraceae bacterium]
MTIDVMIPTYKPGREFIEILNRLTKQSCPVHKIILINTEESLLTEPVKEAIEGLSQGMAELSHISKAEFDHAAVRHRGMDCSGADFVLFMTQDAVPANSRMVEELALMLQSDPRIAVAYARQLPKENAALPERCSREFNYPGRERVKSIDDLPELGVKTFFCSDVCAMYRRDVFYQVGGFEEKAIFNEDMIYACKAMRAGYLVGYASKAEVFHSHNYGFRDQFHRNFDLAVSQADHPEVFGGISSEQEGMRMISRSFHYFTKHKKPWAMVPFLWQCVGRYSGYLLGKRYGRLPRRVILMCTSNKEYWDHVQI